MIQCWLVLIVELYKEVGILLQLVEQWTQLSLQSTQNVFNSKEWKKNTVLYAKLSWTLLIIMLTEIKTHQKTSLYLLTVAQSIKLEFWKNSLLMSSLKNLKKFIMKKYLLSKLLWLIQKHRKDFSVTMGKMLELEHLLILMLFRGIMIFTLFLKILTEVVLFQITTKSFSLILRWKKEFFQNWSSVNVSITSIGVVPSRSLVSFSMPKSAPSSIQKSWMNKNFRNHWKGVFTLYELKYFWGNKKKYYLKINQWLSNILSSSLIFIQIKILDWENIKLSEMFMFVHILC